MSVFQPDNTLSDFLVENYEWSREGDDFHYEINRRYRLIASSVNCREIANYQAVTPDAAAGATTVESVTGQQWFDLTDTQNPKMTFRKVVQFLSTALAAGTNTFAHNISGIGAAFLFTNVHGGLRNAAGTLFVPIPNGDGSIGGDVNVEVDTTDVRVSIPVGSPYIGFFGVVVLEYLKN